MKTVKRLVKNKKGFTFVECIIAVALFAIIGTMAYSMFNNATRYMSKARKEEEKQNIAQSMAQQETFKWPIGSESAGLYKIYPSNMLVEEIIQSGSTEADEEKTIKNYYVVMTYTTKYGDVKISIPVAPAPDSAGNQPGVSEAPTFPSFMRYVVLTDGVSSSGKITGRYVYIYTGAEPTEIGELEKTDEYED